MSQTWKRLKKNWVFVGLIWGFLMFVVMVLIDPIFGKSDFGLTQFVLGLLLWPGGGLEFGYITAGLSDRDR